MFIELKEKVSHYRWRILVRRERRRRIRQNKAKERDKRIQEEQEALLSDPAYLWELEEYQRLQEEADKFEEEENERMRTEWELRDAALHSKFLREKEKRILQEESRLKQEALIKQEWEEEQQKKKEEEEKKKEKQVWMGVLKKPCNQILGHLHPNRKLFSMLLRKVLARIAKRLQKDYCYQDGDEQTHNPEPPANYLRKEYNQAEREPCPFFSKTGACRFSIHCSREHNYPDVSEIILIPHMYTHFGMEKAGLDEYDEDASLEYTDNETYEHFREFYEDVLPEFKKIGSVMQFKVCCNASAHLRGNLYVQFSSEEEAMKACSVFNGRWYAGRQLNCIFVNIIKWKAALCRLYLRNRRNGCPKGGQCNFIHAYHNPGNAYWRADQDLPPQGPIHHSHMSDDRMRERSRWGYPARRSRERREGSSSHSRSRSVRSSSRRSRSRSSERSSHKSSDNSQIRIEDTKKNGNRRSLSPLRKSESRRRKSSKRRRSRSRSKSRSHPQKSTSPCDDKHFRVTHKSKHKSRSRSSSVSPKRSRYRSRSPKRSFRSRRSRSRSPGSSSKKMNGSDKGSKDTK